MDREMNTDQYILYTRSEYGPMRYVESISEEHRPRFSEDPARAMKMDLSTARKVDQITPLHIHREPWTPGLQTELEKAYTPESKVIHYSTSIYSAEESARTACGNVINVDSVTGHFGEVTCDTCIRRAHGNPVSPRDLPRGQWPIKGTYYGHDIRTLPASYWCWVIDKTDMVKPGSYLHDFFLKNELTFRRRAGKKRRRRKPVNK